MTDGHLTVIAARLNELERTLRALAPVRPEHIAPGTRAEAWLHAERSFDRVRSAVDKALADGAPRGAAGRPDRTDEPGILGRRCANCGAPLPGGDPECVACGAVLGSVAP